MLLNSKNTFALSLSQQDIYIEQKLYKNNPMHNIGGVIHFNAIDEIKLKGAHKKLVTEHDSFGLRILECDNKPIQYVSKERNVELEIIDFSQSNTPEDDADTWLKNLFETCFDLENSELFRSFLLKTSSNIYQYVGFAHHLIMDGWGFANWAKLLGEYYNDSPQRVIASWHDVVASDIKYLKSNRYLEHKLYWTSELSSIPENLIPKLKNNEFKNKSLVPSQRNILKVSSLRHQALELKAKSIGSNIVQAYLAIVSCYFAKLNDCSEFIIGIPSHNRRSAAEKNQVGLFTSISPLKVSVNPDDSFFDLCKSLGAKMKKNYRHQRFPISHINKILPQKKLKIFDVVFNYLKLDSRLNIEGEQAELKYLSHNHEQTPLVITIWEYKDSEEIEVQFDHNLAYLSEHDVNLLKDRFDWILKQVVEQDVDNIHNIQLIPHNELKQIQGFVKGKKANYPKDQLIHQLFEEQARLHPDHLAGVFEDNELTYRELNEASNQLAHHLRAQGVEAETLVGLCVERSLEMVIGILAILKVGGAYVPIDPTYPQARIQHMLDDAKLKYILTQSSLSSVFTDVETRHLIELDSALIKKKLQTYLSSNLQQIDHQNSLAYVIYTSGSSGLPKGVACYSKSVINLLHQFEQLAPIGQEMSTLNWTSLSFDVSVYEIMSALIYGRTLHIITNEMRMDPNSLFDFIQKNDIGSTYLPPFFIKEFIFWLKSQNRKPRIKRLLVGVESIILKDLKSIQELIPEIQIVNGYGPSETTICSSLYKVELNKNSLSFFAPIGRPVNNSQLFVLNESKQLVPEGNYGELYIGGHGLARGYLNQPDLTAERFIQNPFSDDPSERLYKTGDLVRYLPDGNMEFIGRIDDQVKIRGFRIELGEINSQLSQNDNVAASLVLAIDVELGQKRLVAYLVAKSGKALDVKTLVSGLRQSLQQNLPDYMLPSAFVVLDEFPLTPNGKVDRKALPAPDGLKLQGEYVPPQSEYEKKMVSIWAELLNFDAKTISVTADFFELGGDSLLLTKLGFLVNQEFNLNLELSDLYGINNLQMMSHAIEEAVNLANKNTNRNKTIVIDL